VLEPDAVAIAVIGTLSRNIRPLFPPAGLLLIRTANLRLCAIKARNTRSLSKAIPRQWLFTHGRLTDVSIDEERKEPCCEKKAPPARLGLPAGFIHSHPVC